MSRVTEDTRRVFTRALMWGAWVISVTLVTLRVTPLADLGQEWGIVIVLFIGVAIAAGQARTRHKLSDTIVGAFDVGMRAAGEARDNKADKKAEEIKQVVIANREMIRDLERHAREDLRR